MPVIKEQLTSQEFTYGASTIEILSWDKTSQITIGKFCSIAKNVKILLGGNHHSEFISTYPFGYRRTDVFNKPFEYENKPPKGVIIGSDVWIGYGVSIMDNITIGDGSIIAAFSHVVKDVSPYSMVGGNPACLIKYRFSQEVIDKLLKLKWWDLPTEKINELIPILKSEDINSLFETLQGN